MKTCNRCGDSKSLDDFYRNAGMPDGHLKQCKACTRERQRAYQQTPRGREVMSAARRRYLERNPEASRRSRRAQYDSDPEGFRAKRRAIAERAYARDPEAAKRRVREHEARAPEQVAARRAVRNALRDGVLARPDLCEGCGSEGLATKDGRSPIQAHHADYSRPLDVTWLCTACHGAEHREPVVV